MPPPPPPVLGETLDLNLDLTFDSLDIEQFDEPVFAATFSTELATAVAVAAGVEAWRVSPGAVVAGSVVASVLVQFEAGAYSARDAFVATVQVRRPPCPKCALSAWKEPKPAMAFGFRAASRALLYSCYRRFFV
jgi:hypothetical protein